LKRVYLDQNTWIALASSHYGKSKDPAAADALAVARAGVEAGHLSFPLSATHYMETFRRGDPASRQRLGAFMAELSRFHAIAAAPDVLEAELRLAMYQRGGQPKPTTPRVFGIGAKHAFGRLTDSYFSDPDAERRAVRRFGVDSVNEYFERALITGPSERLPWQGIQAPSDEWSRKQLQLEMETAARLRAEGHSRDLAHRCVLAQEVTDMWDLAQRLMEEMRVPNFPMSAEALTALIFDLPAKGLITRMRMTGHENPTFRWHLGDLHDMTALGMAAAYCDVVVAEKHWGHVLSRSGEYCRAKLVTSLGDATPALIT
jgi:hypothetical protein